MLAKKVRLQDLSDEEQVLTPTYGQRLLRQSLPRYNLPEGEMSPQTVYNVIRDELMLEPYSISHSGSAIVVGWFQRTRFQRIAKIWRCSAL